MTESCAKAIGTKLGDGYQIKSEEDLIRILSHRGFHEEAFKIAKTIYGNFYPEFYGDRKLLRVAPDYLFVHLVEDGLQLSLHGPSPIHGLPHRAIAGTFHVRKVDGSVKVTKWEYNGENVLKE